MVDRAMPCARVAAIIVSGTLEQIHRAAAQRQVQRTPVDQPLHQRRDGAERRVARCLVLHEVPFACEGRRRGRRDRERRRRDLVRARAARVQRHAAPLEREAVVGVFLKEAKHGLDGPCAVLAANEAIRLSNAHVQTFVSSCVARKFGGGKRTSFSRFSQCETVTRKSLR